MVNRLKPYFGEEPEETPVEEDFFIVTGDAGFFYITRETAQRIARELSRRRPPRWITFRDLAGSEIRVRPAKLDAVYECTRAQRSRERAFLRARKQEEKQDRRPWEEDG